MKKLLVLSVLLVLMALPMFASDITFGGDVTFGYINDFDGVTGRKTDLTFDVKAAIDDFNALVINMDGFESLSTAGIKKAIVTTDVGKWLGLPVGLKVVWGYDDPDWASFGGISSYDAWGIYLSDREYWGVDFLLSAGKLDVEVAFEPLGAAAASGSLLATVAVKEPIPGLSAEAAYYVADGKIQTFADGVIAFDAVYATEVAGIALKAAPGFTYDMGAESWAWIFAAKGSMGMFALDFEVTGDDVDAFAGMDAVVNISAVDKADIYAGLVLSFRDGDDAFQGADVGVKAKMGATNLYVGYLITELGKGNLNAAADTLTPLPLNGGVYFKFDVNY